MRRNYYTRRRRNARYESSASTRRRPSAAAGANPNATIDDPVDAGVPPGPAAVPSPRPSRAQTAPVAPAPATAPASSSVASSSSPAARRRQRRRRAGRACAHGPSTPCALVSCGRRVSARRAAAPNQPTGARCGRTPCDSAARRCATGTTVCSRTASGRAAPTCAGATCHAAICRRWAVLSHLLTRAASGRVYIASSRSSA